MNHRRSTVKHEDEGGKPTRPRVASSAPMLATLTATRGIPLIERSEDGGDPA